jgi:hypothetical protein
MENIFLHAYKFFPKIVVIYFASYEYTSENTPLWIYFLPVSKSYSLSDVLSTYNNFEPEIANG